MLSSNGVQYNQSEDYKRKKAMNFQFEDSHKGTLATIFLSILGGLSIDDVSKIVFVVATFTTGTLTSVYTYHKIQKLKNETSDKEH